MRTALKRYITALILTLAAAVVFAAAATAQTPAADRLEISVDDAVIMALENNDSMRIQKMNPELKVIAEEQQKAAFDASLSGSLSNSSSESASGSKSRSTRESVSISKQLESGADITIGLSSSNSGSGSDNYTSRFGISFTKPLFNGAGSGVNLAGLKQAEMDTESSHYELQGYAESLIEQVISTYWDYALAQRRLEIYEKSMELARRQHEEAKTMVEIGKLAEIELIASEAEVAMRQQSLIDARGQLEKTALKLLRLIDPRNMSDFNKKEIVLKDQFKINEVDLGAPETHIETALESRPDLKQARLSLAKGELDVVKTRNGLLPALDFYITLGRTGYAGSFGGSYKDILTDAYDAQAGISYQYDFGRRSDRARYDSTLIRQEQQIIAMSNMEAVAIEDLWTSLIEIDRSGNQVKVSAASLKLQEEKYRAEQEKYRVGKSTTIAVSQAERDLLQSRVDESRAIADYNKAVVALYLAEGVLLKKLGISIL